MSLKLASLNIRGYQNLEDIAPKWYHVNQLLREKKIGILAVQEFYLNKAQRSEIEDLFEKRLVILNSENPNNATAKGRVAFVLNKNLINTTDINFEKVVKERATLLKACWHNDQKITILAIYALNVILSNAIENGVCYLQSSLYGHV